MYFVLMSGLGLEPWPTYYLLDYGDFLGTIFNLILKTCNRISTFKNCLKKYILTVKFYNPKIFFYLKIFIILITNCNWNCLPICHIVDLISTWNINNKKIKYIPPNNLYRVYWKPENKLKTIMHHVIENLIDNAIWH